MALAELRAAAGMPREALLEAAALACEIDPFDPMERAILSDVPRGAAQVRVEDDAQGVGDRLHGPQVRAAPHDDLAFGLDQRGDHLAQLANRYLGAHPVCDVVGTDHDDRHVRRRSVERDERSLDLSAQVSGLGADGGQVDEVDGPT